LQRRENVRKSRERRESTEREDFDVDRRSRREKDNRERRDMK